MLNQPSAPSGNELASAGPSQWRATLGVSIIGLMLALWLLVPLAALLDLAGSTVAALTGGLFIINKVLLLVAVAVMGKSGFQELKRRLFGYVKGLAPAAETPIGPVRHVLGLVMFCLPLLTAMLEPYVDRLWPGLRPNLWQLQVLGDLMLIASFFVLGGNFWEKLRALFVRRARVTMMSAG